MKATKIVLLSVVTALAVLAGACSSDASFVCERRKECVSSGLDVDMCITDIENYADDSSANAGKVEDCAACIDGKSCSEAIANCGAECFGVPGW